ncbi:MAG: hypothetical protein HDT28_05540 [Clostridiales bacterium]|nr:hypothetical protein [Clostridiales bacterium]
MDNVRYNISPCEEREVNDFIDKIDTKLFVPNGTVRATERSHYDRYSFLRDETKVAVVYDTTASIVSITGRYDFAKELLDLFGSDSKSVKRSTVPAQGAAVKPENTYSISQMQTTNVGGDMGMRAKLFVAPDSLRRRSEFGPAPTVFASAKGAIISTDEIFPPQTCKKRNDGFKRDIALNGNRPNDRSSNSFSNANGGTGSFGGNGGNAGHGGLGGNGGFGGNGGNGGTSIVKRPLTSYGEFDGNRVNVRPQQGVSNVQRDTEHSDERDGKVGIAISVGSRTPSLTPRRATISFGSDDEGKTTGAGLKPASRPDIQQASDSGKRKRGRPPKKLAQADNVTGEKTTITFAQPIPSPQQQQSAQVNAAAPKKRGRPPKDKSAQPSAKTDKTEYKNGYSVKNCPLNAIESTVKYFKSRGVVVALEQTDGDGDKQEVVAYTLTDGMGQKVLLRYASKRKTLQLQGKETKLFGEVVEQLNRYVGEDQNKFEQNGGKAVRTAKADKKLAEIDAKLKKRLPTAYDFLSEQARKDFSYGIHDFGVSELVLSDYSVLLVPAFRGLERFVFDLQRAEGINVKMIGQAYDKDESGKYVLKSGYTKRINSVVYAEVMVALYTEYFAQRNFFAHSDNTDSNLSRSIPERADAKRIFDRLLDVVEYNAKKLKEINFKL